MTAVAHSTQFADVHSSSAEYANRFTGPIGQWFLNLQTSMVLDAVKRIRASGRVCETVLDVGGGHAQIARPLAAHGLKVTVLGSDALCAVRLNANSTNMVEFAIGDILSPPFPPQSFDLVTCFRILSHCDEWPVLIRALARCARSGVIIDYPTLRSLNVATPALFTLKKKIEGNTRSYGIFRDKEIDAIFQSQEFDRLTRAPQFFYPMGVHRALKCAAVSRGLEAMTRALGLTAIFGSPVIATWTRRSMK